MKKYSIPLLIILILISALLFLLRKKTESNAKASPRCKNCNVVIISLDTIRASQLPCYGYPRNTMPNLCRFADQNIRFDQAYSQSSWTFPNATSVMTGLYPSEHGMYDNIIDVLNPQTTTLPKLYKKAGYHTVAIINSQETNIPVSSELLKQFDTVISTRGFHLEQETKTWLDTFTQLSTSQKPFFLYIYTTYVGYYRSTDIGISSTFPLDPTFTPPPFVSDKTFTENIRHDALTLIQGLKKMATDFSAQQMYETTERNLSAQATWPQAKRAFDTLTEGQKLFLYQEEVARRLDPKKPEHLRYIHNLYDANIAKLDNYLGPLLDKISDTKHNKNTLAIIYSDHGENLGDHGLWGHAMAPFSTLTHVPLIMHIPHTTPQIHNNMVQLFDLFPTLTALTQIKTQDKLHGRNIWIDSKQSEKKSNQQFTIAQLNNGNDASIKTPDWLLIMHRNAQNTLTNELYDLQTDPDEKHDIAASRTDVVERLLLQYQQETTRKK